MANTLFLRLEAPLQSWGERGQWMVRDTAPEPTKSGIVGLLACALGWRDDARIAGLARAIRVGVRCDLPGTPSPLEDYHTVGGGYRKPQLLRADGEPKYVATIKAPHTEPTVRAYLNDASFLAAVSATDDWIEKLADAVQSPHWPIFLGRKSCVPARPVFDDVGDYSSLREALQAHPARLFVEQWRKKDRPRMINCRAVIECQPHEPGTVRRNDLLVSRAYRLFEPRYSLEVRLEGVAVEWIGPDLPDATGV